MANNPFASITCFHPLLYLFFPAIFLYNWIIETVLKVTKIELRETNRGFLFFMFIPIMVLFWVAIVKLLEALGWMKYLSYVLFWIE